MYVSYPVMEIAYSKYGKILLYCAGAGMQVFTNVTIVNSPAGTPVNGSTNTFSYRILSSVTLTCDTDPPASPSTNIGWPTDGCTGCFPSGQTNRMVNESVLTPVDAGTFTCSAQEGGDTYYSDPFTLVIDCKLII